MKKLLIASLLPLLFFACTKTETTNSVFRTPSCEDTTDDGIFENYSMAEASQFLRFYRNVPDAEDTSVVRFKYMSGHILTNRGVVYDPYLVYKVKKPTMLTVYLPYYSQQQQYYSWVQTSVDTSRTDTINIYEARPLNLPAGCYRLYYVFSDTDTGTVYNKGHYDIQIK